MRGVFAFEGIGRDLKLLPLAARRALDVAGLKLSLAAWAKLPQYRRRRLVDLGRNDRVDTARVRETVAAAEPAAQAIAAADESLLEPTDDCVGALLGDDRPLPAQAWQQLDRLARFALRHVASRADRGRMAAAYDDIVAGRLASLTHISPQGSVSMVAVGGKRATQRRAVARARVRMRPETARLALAANGPKGDVLGAARIAGIMAAKKTSELVPLCHPLALSRVVVELCVDVARGEVAIEAAAEAHDRTGVEMEAMTAASVAALTIYDMLKAVQRDMVIEEIVLLEKSGGRSGRYAYGGGGRRAGDQ